MHRGSRKHVLDWTDRPAFLSELRELLPEVPREIEGEVHWMPQGHGNPDEGRLETFGPSWLPGHPAWREMEDWWLKHKRGANTPNWDIAVGCTIEDRPGLVLVEAKANWPELSTAGKLLRSDASQNSHQNHAHIGAAIEVVIEVVVPVINPSTETPRKPVWNNSISATYAGANSPYPE